MMLDAIYPINVIVIATGVLLNIVLKENASVPSNTYFGNFPIPVIIIFFKIPNLFVHQ